MTRLQHLKIMGDWVVSDVNSVLGACQEVAAVDLELLRIRDLDEHSSLCTHPFARCFLERLGCVQELMVDSLESFGQLEGQIGAEPTSARPLTSLRGLEVFYNGNLEHVDIDIEICLDLIALSPNLVHVEMLDH